MALIEIISKLGAAQVAEKQEIYLNIIKLLNENVDSTYNGLNKEHVKSLCSSILNDLKKETVELPQLGKILQITFQNKNFQTFLPESEKVDFIKDVIYTIDPSEHENILVNCFSVLIQVPFNFKLENAVLNELLKRMEDVLTKKNEPASTYSVCNCFQKFLRENEAILSEFTHLLSKLVFLPLCHPSNKVREVAEKNLDAFPKILLYSCDEDVTASVLKLVKESYSKEMLQLFKEKQELYVLKVWKHVVNALGSALPKNLPGISSFFQVIEKGFKSPVDEICIASFNAWKSLIDTFAGCNGVLNDSRRLRFVLKPLKNITRTNENILLAACDAWMHLVWNLADHLSSRFSEVCIPLLELTVGKIPNGLSEKTLPKGGTYAFFSICIKDGSPVSLVKKSCYILLRLLEQPPSESFNRLSSPKKLPFIPYPTLQKPLDIKIITHHFKEILYTFKIIIDVCGTKEDMRANLDCLMKSVLFIVSAVIEDSNKESKESVNHYLSFLTDIVEEKAYPPLSCLKCIESLSKLPRKVLVSHCFNCGSRTTQVILCISLLKLLLNPHLFPSEIPKRFYATYNRLIQAGIYESFHPLLNTHKFMHMIRSSIGTNSFDVDMLIEIWSGVATPLLDTIEKTQEVNQGDKHEHDFSCMYDVLIFPFEFIFPEYIQQFRTRPAFKLWMSLYKAFIHSSSLVATTSVNEACENFCLKLKILLKEENLQKPYFFESLCSHMQSIIELIDFASGATSSVHGISDVALLMKRKKPLGNFTSFVDLVAIILKAYLTHYIETEDSFQSSTPTIQRKLHIVKSGVPLDILKTFFSNIKSGSIIPYVLEQLIDPVSKLFTKSSQRKNSTNHIDSKLEMLWNVISSSIERYYLGPYDSEFLILMTPLLEATFSHSKRNIKEKSRRFWFATFGPNASSLKFPDSLKDILKKMKLSLLPDDISQTEFSVSPISDSVTEDSIDVNVPSIPKTPVQNPEPFKSPLSVNGETSKVITKEKKQPPKVSIDDLPVEEFVKIESSVISHRRNIRKRKSFVPSLYNDLSQDSATLLSSCESQDTTCSASLEKDDIKLPVDESKAISEKSFPSTSYKTVSGESGGVLNSSLSSKFDENIDKCLRKDTETILIESSDSSLEVEMPNSKKLKSNSPTQDKIEEKDKEKHSKISVFSMPGDKKIALRSTRKNLKLSQSFSVLSSKKESEKLEYQKLNKSCVELIDLNDSEEIIPSSQGSSEIENSIKLSVTNEQEKSEVVGSCNSNLEELEPTKMCVKNQNEESGKKNSEFEGENLKIITSTPSKSKIPPLIEDKSEALVKNHEDVLDDNPALPISALNSDKPVESSTSVQIADEKEQITVNEPKINGSSKETIKDLNFILDAVDNMGNVPPPTVETDKKGVANLELQPDVEMKDVSESNEKPICSISINVEDENVQSWIDVPVEPMAKKARFNLRKPETVSSETENYTKKLRKKNVSSLPKPQPKGRKKKEVKKIDSLMKENESNDNMNGSKVFDSETNKTELKSNEEVCCQQPENLDLDENIDSSSDMCIEQSLEKSNVPEAKDSMNNLENIGNAESCDIFGAFSDSCKASDDNFKEQNDSEMMSVDSKDSGSISDSDNINSDNADSQINETNEIPSEALDANNPNAVTIVPCSLEDDKVMETSHESIDEAVNDKTVTDFDQPMEQSFVEQSVNINKNEEEMPNSVPIEFSIIEDGVSCEMHNIIESIASACSENSIDDSLKNQSISTEQSMQVPMTSDKEKTSEVVGDNSDLALASPNKPCEVDNETYNNNNSEKLPKYDSTELVLSSESEVESSPEIVENSVAMDIENIPSIVRNGDLDKIKENQIELKQADISQNSLATNNNKNIPLELDHPYFKQQSKISEVVSHDRKNSADVNDDVLNLIQTNESFKVRIKHNKTERSNFDKTTDVGISASSNKKINRKSNTITSENSFKLNSGYEKEYKNELPTKKDFLKDEIGCIIKELIIKVENIDCCQSVSQNSNLISSADNSDSLNLNTAADKENQLSESASDDVFAKGSKKRKIKPPIRSPFNFRQRTKIENSKKIQKGMKSYVSQIKSITEKTDLIIRPIFPNEEKVDNSMANYISKLVDTITVDEDVDDSKEIHPDEPSSSKGTRLELSNDELTDLNTRLNASTAPQTRRSKFIASVHKTPESETEPLQPNVVILCSSADSNSSSKLTSILKKRKSTEPSPPSKARRVSFASPLIHEVLIENISEAEGIEVVTMNRIHSLSRRRNKILQEKNKKTIPSVPVSPVNSTESEDVPSSSEYQDSDVLDFNELPVSPALINCPDKVTNILKDLTSPSWIRGLESLLVSKSIKTIGDLCKLNIHQIKALPFKSPKVLTLHKALMGYISTTQEATLQKFKTIDDGSFEAEVPSSSNSCDSKTAKNTVENPEKNASKTLEEAVVEVVKKGRLKELPVSVLGQLVEACGKAIIEKHKP